MEQMFQISILGMVEDLIERTRQKEARQHAKKLGRGNCGHDSRRSRSDSFIFTAFSKCF